MNMYLNTTRKYVISRMPGLTTLDASAVTDEERNEASRAYSTLKEPSKTAALAEDIRAPAPPPEPVKPQPKPVKKRKKKVSAAALSGNSALPEFTDDGKPGAPPPPVAGQNADEESEDESSEFTSGEGNSSDWTDADEDDDDSEEEPIIEVCLVGGGLAYLIFYLDACLKSGSKAMSRFRIWNFLARALKCLSYLFCIILYLLYQ